MGILVDFVAAAEQIRQKQLDATSVPIVAAVPPVPDRIAWRMSAITAALVLRVSDNVPDGEIWLERNGEVVGKTVGIDT